MYRGGRATSLRGHDCSTGKKQLEALKRTTVKGPEDVKSTAVKALESGLSTLRLGS